MGAELLPDKWQADFAGVEARGWEQAAKRAGELAATMRKCAAGGEAAGRLRPRVEPLKLALRRFGSTVAGDCAEHVDRMRHAAEAEDRCELSKLAAIATAKAKALHKAFDAKQADESAKALRSALR